MNKLYIVSILTLASTFASAENNDTSLCLAGYSVYYLNGINTDKRDAFEDAKRVEAALGSIYEEEPITHKVSYNPTQNILLDLVEAFEQKIDEDPSLTWSLFFRWASGRFINTTLQNLFIDFMSSDGAETISDTASRLSSPIGYTDRTVTQHAATYESELLAGKRVMLVAHSQGNLYSNAIHSALARGNSAEFDLSALGIASVATPANGVATGDRYVTSDTDRVIDLVRAVQPSTLPSNNSSVPILQFEDFYFGHSFSGIYMAKKYSSLRGQTIGVMNSTLARLSNVTTTEAAGPITATLNWSRAGDVDLHTYEPSGFHVYYASRTGNVGFLDRDDTSGTGPEHYYTTCDNFVEGRYSFGVNYYSGEGSRRATIKMSVLGIDYPERSIILGSPEGSGGNNNPSILFRVDVTKDENGVYDANVN